MIFRRESEKEKLLRMMKIHPRKKMEWLYQMHELMRSAYSKKQREIFWKLRESR